jgi:hypothetical protein
MTLESGPAKADRNWHLVRTILFLAFAVWFVYDGVVRYPAENTKEAQQELAAPEPFNGQVKYEALGETPTGADYNQLKAKPPTTAEELHAQFGKPQFTRGAGPRAEEFYVSRYGYLAVRLESGRVRPGADSLFWRPWKHDKNQITQQFYWAIVPLIPGLYFLSRLYKAATLRVSLDDEGLTYAGQRIALADMVSLRDYSPKGWIDLYYKVGEHEKKLRLDNEKVLRFDELVAAICEAKGFKNEVTEYAAERAATKAETEAAQVAEDKPDAGDSPT